MGDSAQVQDAVLIGALYSTIFCAKDFAMPRCFRKIHARALSSIAAALLVACGGGGSGGSPGGNPISGTVIDGYIEGAKVCLDLNANGACDVGEPSATTDSNGKYTLAPGSANTANLNLIAEIPETAKDSDDGGQTLAAAGKSAYTMATFADQPAVLTPLTTLIVGKVTSESLTVAAAKVSVLQTLGLPAGTNPYEDHIASGNTVVQVAARQVAAQLQVAQSDLTAGTPAADRFATILGAMKAYYSAGSIAMESSDPDPLNMPASLSDVATGRLFAYKMPSAKGQEINATAMLFTPRGPAPQDGWPLVVFGHGTVGVAQHCAPSVTMKAGEAWLYTDLVALLVQQGYVVVAPDYEGLGSADMGVVTGHPYLHLESAGRSMALAAVASKKLLGDQLSGTWATVGHSQGGHAALAGGQFSELADKRMPGMSFKGAVAMAPASNFKIALKNFTDAVYDMADLSANSLAYRFLQTGSVYAAYLVKGSEESPSPILVNQVLGHRMQAVYNNKVATECLGQLSDAVGEDISEYASLQNATPAGYPGVNGAALNVPSIVSYLESIEPGKVRLFGETLLIAGSEDTTVLPDTVLKLQSTMFSNGSSVSSLIAGPQSTHSGLLGMQVVKDAVIIHLSNLLSPS